MNKSVVNAGILLFGKAISNFGDYVYIVALNVIVLERTHSPVAVAGLWVMGPLAGVIGGPWIGGLADRFRRRNAMVAAEIFRAVLLFILPFVEKLPVIFAVVLLLALADKLFAASAGPYLREIVAKEHLPRVNSISRSVRSAALIIGPGVAAALLASHLPQITIWADSGSFVVSAITLGLLPGGARPQPKPGAAKGGSVRKDVSLVLNFVSENRHFLVIYALVNLGIVAVTCGDAQQVVFVLHALHLNGANYGELVAIAGAGLFIGSMLCLTFSPKLSFRYLIGLSSVFGAGAFLLFASSSDLTTAALGLFMLGLFQAFNATGFVTYLQRAIPLEIMGRVISTLGTAVQAATIVGVILGGWLSQDAGPRALMLTVGVVFFGVGIAISLFGWREPSFSQPLSANAKS